MELDNVNVKILVMNDEEFNSFQRLLSNNNIGGAGLKIAIGSTILGEPCIIAHEDLFNLDKKLQYLILSKEAAFTLGYADSNDDADKWVMDGLDDETKKLLASSKTR